MDGVSLALQSLFMCFISEKPLSASAECAGSVKMRSIRAMAFLEPAAQAGPMVDHFKV